MVSSVVTDGGMTIISTANAAEYNSKSVIDLGNTTKL